MSEVKVTITVTGDRCSGKSTVLKIAQESLRDAGFKVSDIETFGEEVLKEYIVVTTANVVTRTEWLTRS